MQLAAIYNVWDGLEHFENSILSIRKSVDFVVVVWQKTSNWGVESQDVERVVLELKAKGLIDVDIQLEPKHSVFEDWRFAQAHEKLKRQTGLNKAKELGATHFLSIDTDEFYDPIKFRKAKEYIEAEDIEASAVKIRIFYKRVDWCLNKFDETLCPFICKLNPHTKTGIKRCNVQIDPTRSTAKTYTVLEPEMLIMRHLSWVRDSIESKLLNSTARKNIYRTDILEEYRKAEIGSVLQSIYTGSTLIVAPKE